ncbi:MAG: NUDIX hydrolase [Anaerolineae bacterium]|nr:NUDIX hydrolase [Anaerolineae bacterium]
MSKNPYQKLSSQRVWQTRWMALREDQIKLPDGSQGTYTVIERPGAVWIVPLLSDGQMVLIWNYRYTVGKWLWEVPAGSIVPGISPEEMAHRELSEEIGGTAASLKQISTFYTWPGQCNEIGYIFLAQGVKLGEPHREPTEVMERHVFPAEKALEMARSGKVADGPSALAILMCAPILASKQSD